MALDKIEKDFGKGSIMRLGDKSSVNVDCIPTGALALDIALGVGGVPRGRELLKFTVLNQAVKPHLPSIS